MDRQNAGIPSRRIPPRPPPSVPHPSPLDTSDTPQGFSADRDDNANHGWGGIYISTVFTHLAPVSREERYARPDTSKRTEMNEGGKREKKKNKNKNLSPPCPPSRYPKQSQTDAT